MKQKNLVIFSVVFLLLAFVAAAWFYQSYQADAAAQAYLRDKSTYVRSHTPARGSPDAKVEIVEFFDPACGTCREFHPLLERMLKDHPGKIRLYERYTPLHDGSETVVKMLAAAHLQGKFWPTLEAIFAAQPAWAPQHRPQPELVWNYIGGVGLDLERLRRDMSSPEIDKIIQQDLADARKLGVKATPEFFVNGKPLPSWGYEQLKTLVADELSAAY